MANSGFNNKHICFFYIVVAVFFLTVFANYAGNPPEKITPELIDSLRTVVSSVTSEWTSVKNSIDTEDERQKAISKGLSLLKRELLVEKHGGYEAAEVAIYNAMEYLKRYEKIKLRLQVLKLDNPNNKLIPPLLDEILSIDPTLFYSGIDEYKNYNKSQKVSNKNITKQKDIKFEKDQSLLTARELEYTIATTQTNKLLKEIYRNQEFFRSKYKYRDKLSKKELEEISVQLLKDYDYLTKLSNMQLFLILIYSEKRWGVQEKTFLDSAIALKEINFEIDESVSQIEQATFSRQINSMKKGSKQTQVINYRVNKGGESEKNFKTLEEAEKAYDESIKRNKELRVSRAKLYEWLLKKSAELLPSTMIALQNVRQEILKNNIFYPLADMLGNFDKPLSDNDIELFLKEKYPTEKDIWEVLMFEEQELNALKLRFEAISKPVLSELGSNQKYFIMIVNEINQYFRNRQYLIFSLKNYSERIAESNSKKKK